MASAILGVEALAVASIQSISTNMKKDSLGDGTITGHLSIIRGLLSSNQAIKMDSMQLRRIQKKTSLLMKHQAKCKELNSQAKSMTSELSQYD